MRRLVAMALVVAAAAVSLAASGGGGDTPTYRVDAIFDNASLLIPGNVVKVAGAPVGEVSDIRLTGDRKARVEMKVEEGFAPFREDARCVVAPESIFIGEKFVQCEPGTPRAGPLRERDGRPPTIPLERNSSTVDLDLVMSTLRLPVRQRLAILLNELGAGLAGRPKELAETVRRANPALGATNRVLRILDEDRATLGRLVDHSDEVLAELAARRGGVQGFIEESRKVTRATADRRDDLQEAVRRLPPLLDELEPSARRLRAFAGEATPALRRLRSAAPSVTALLRDVEPLSRAGRPALRSLGRTARVGRGAIRPTRPVARRLATAARLMPANVSLLTDLAISLRDSGALEGIQSFIHYTALSTSRFDRFSHILPAYAIGTSCLEYATEPNPACDAHFGGSAGSPASRAREARRPSRGGERQGQPRAPAPRPAPRARDQAPQAPTPGETPAPPPPAQGPSPSLPQVPDLPGGGDLPLLDYLLGQ